jgi:hypothetical protein
MNICLNELSKPFAEIVEEMMRRGIDCRQIPRTTLIEAQYGATKHIFSQHTLPIIPQFYPKLINNKRNFKALLRYLHIPYLLESKIFSPTDKIEALAFAEQTLGFPVITKPKVGMTMLKVFCNIQSLAEMSALWSEHYESLTDNEVIVEKFLPNATAHQMIGFGDGTRAILRRFKPQVTGNGESNIQELVDMLNTDRKNNKPYFSPIPLSDAEIIRCISGQGFTLKTVIPSNVTIELHYGTDMSKGGEFDVMQSQEAHPLYWELFYNIWDIFPKMPFFGLDILSTDISQPPHPSRTAINEAAVGPSISSFFAAGDPYNLNVVGRLVDIVFPESKLGELSLQ